MPGDGGPRPGGLLDVPGAVPATGGLVAASYGLVRTDAWSWGSAGVLAPLAVGAVLLAAFAAVERRVRDPLLPPGFLRDGRRVFGLAATALTAAGTSTVFVLFSLHLQDERGWSALRASAAFLPFAAALLASGRAAGPLVGRYGPGAVTGGGLALGAAGLALLTLTGLDAGVPYGCGVLPGFVLLPAGPPPPSRGRPYWPPTGCPPGVADWPAVSTTRRWRSGRPSSSPCCSPSAATGRAWQAGGGAIVNVSSNLGQHKQVPGATAYSATKAAVTSLTRGAALEYIADGVRINAVSPGASDTSMSLLAGETEAERAARMKEQSPLGRVSTAQEVAQAVLYLASDAAASLVGTDLVIDGGASV